MPGTPPHIAVAVSCTPQDNQRITRVARWKCVNAFCDMSQASPFPSTTTAPRARCEGRPTRARAPHAPVGELPHTAPRNGSQGLGTARVQALGRDTALDQAPPGPTSSRRRLLWDDGQAQRDGPTPHSRPPACSYPPGVARYCGQTGASGGTASLSHSSTPKPIRGLG